MATSLPLLPRRLPLPAALRMDLLLPSSKDVLRRDVGVGAVEADVFITLDVTLHQPLRIVERQWLPRTDALPYERQARPYCLHSATPDVPAELPPCGHPVVSDLGHFDDAAHFE